MVAKVASSLCLKVQFIDVSTPDNPVSLGIVDTPGRARDVELFYDSQKDAYYPYVADDRDDLQIIEAKVP